MLSVRGRAFVDVDSMDSYVIAVCIFLYLHMYVAIIINVVEIIKYSETISVRECFISASFLDRIWINDKWHKS